MYIDSRNVVSHFDTFATDAVNNWKNVTRARSGLFKNVV